MHSKPALEWSDSYALGYPPMDSTHQEFVVLARAVLLAADDTIAERMDALATHTQAHFDQEAEWMTSTAFPPSQCHLDEHEAVLKSVYEVQQQLASGENGAIDTARSLAMELLKWFPGHAAYLDSALAQWMAKRAYGGAPIVFHRS
ncbi:hemerythrin [Sinimarinibacterium sp. CAU 1509]|uniref:bacteriohemerythrin n=1 Tax=Sinimarinibacterium sp. CAU 1509 TaxID=2562283 RepID=UPI0010AD3F6A|nr:hemerythrin domain-containing protein [Sinimarinibacterium sp. CAU 1509]TJY63132.1 hemerythrin [Sinimarinibacterium sp. CAU 1509]